VHRLARTDTEQDSQDFEVRYLLRQCGVKAAATLLDKCKMETSSESNGLEVSSDALGVVVADGTTLRADLDQIVREGGRRGDVHSKPCHTFPPSQYFR
jgi:hypothetical protein